MPPVTSADRSRRALALVLVALLTGIFALAMAGSGHGLQQEAGGRSLTRRPVGPPEFGAGGDFPARLQLNGQGEIYLEKVQDVSLRREWAILRFLEEDDGKIATLMVPRESIGYLKIWEDAPQAK